MVVRYVRYPWIIFTLQKHHLKSLIKHWWDLGTTFSWAIIIRYFICSWCKLDQTTKESTYICKFHWICRRRHIAKINTYILRLPINIRLFLRESTVHLIGMQGFYLEILLDLWFARKFKKALFKLHMSQLNWFVCVLTHKNTLIFPPFSNPSPCLGAENHGYHYRVRQDFTMWIRVLKTWATYS